MGDSEGQVEDQLTLSLLQPSVAAQEQEQLAANLARFTKTVDVTMCIGMGMYDVYMCISSVYSSVLSSVLCSLFSVLVVSCFMWSGASETKP